MKKEITEDMKKDFLEGHFDYEIRRIKEGISLMNPDGSTLDIILVGFLTRIRNVYEFFYGSGKGYKTHAGHFIEKWRNKKPPKEIKKWHTQINNFLSHLYYARVKEKYEPYQVHVLYTHFIELTIDFLSELPEKYMNINIRKLLEDLK